MPRHSSSASSGTVSSRRLLLLALIGSGLLLAAASRVAGADPLCRAEYWVSPKGSDAATGDRAHPWRTLERARDAVRQDDRRMRCDLFVNLRGGDYRLAQTVVLDWRDSGMSGHDVVYRAAPGERPVISGAIPVQGWALHDAKLGIYRAFVGAQRTRHLFVNGTRMTRARTESNPDNFERTDSGYRFIKAGATMPVWGNPSEIEAVTVTQWKTMRCPVREIVGPDVLMRDPCWKNANVFQAPPGQQPLWNFRLLSRFENAYEFLDHAGEWYLDSATGWLYYIPRAEENLATAKVELPVLEALVDGRGELDKPVAHIRFEGLTFAYATWLGPSSHDGYAADQSGFHLVGDKHSSNIIGHDEFVVRTPGNVRFRFAQHIEFRDNDFVHLGGVGLDFDTGSQHNAIIDNRFEDISSAGIQLGGVGKQDHHPDHPEEVTRDNRISNNLVRRIGRDYFDAAGIMVGFTTRTLVSHNDISDVPWAGIAIGWGWGLVDPGTFLGLSGATVGMWGLYETPTTSRGNRILDNRIHNFLMELWDGGAIYSLGQQGSLGRRRRAHCGERGVRQAAGGGWQHLLYRWRQPLRHAVRERFVRQSGGRVRFRSVRPALATAAVQAGDIGRRRLFVAAVVLSRRALRQRHRRLHSAR